MDGFGTSVAASQQNLSSSSSSSLSATQSSSSSSSAPPAQTASGTETYLRESNLIAEAAKRAQMAILTRDLDSFGLS